MDWTIVVIAFFGVAGTLGAVFLTNYLNERKERRLKKEKEEELKQSRRIEFYNSYMEMMENEIFCERIGKLVNTEIFNKNLIDQIEKEVENIKTEHFSILRKNTTLSDDDIVIVVGNMNSYIVFRDEVIHQLDLLRNMRKDPDDFKKNILNAIDALKDVNSEVKKYMSSDKFLTFK